MLNATVYIGNFDHDLSALHRNPERHLSNELDPKLAEVGWTPDGLVFGHMQTDDGYRVVCVNRIPLEVPVVLDETTGRHTGFSPSGPKKGKPKGVGRIPTKLTDEAAEALFSDVLANNKKLSRLLQASRLRLASPERSQPSSTAHVPVVQMAAEKGARVVARSPDAELGGGADATRGQPDQTGPDEEKLSDAQLDSMMREQTGGASIGEEGRRYLRVHLATERRPNNRRILLQQRARKGPLACDVCGIDLAMVYGPEHGEVLELHHLVPLSRGVQRPKGTDAFALLCPTCHRVVHYRREEPLEVDVLRARLRG